MKRFLKISAFLSLCLVLAGCPKDDAPGPVEARPHAEVYPEDLAEIEEFLHTFYIDVTKNGDGDVTNVEFFKLDATHTVSIWDQTDYPVLSKIVKLYGIDFKVYYIKLDDKTDTDADGEKPCGIDNVFVTDRGWWLGDKLVEGSASEYEFGHTQFEYSPNEFSVDLANLGAKGWEYIIPEFRTGQNVLNGDGTVSHTNYGSGVMFLPSGLGYYNTGAGTIPTYSPLIFTFNLHSLIRTDNDSDGIESRYEYAFNEDGTLVDTDDDNVPDPFDHDDDNDGYQTIAEISYVHPSDPNAVTRYYPYNGAAVDNPATLYVDETKGIPSCGATPDFTTPTRLRKHLDESCH
nr:hypothetical protein [uncultured Flavobacterium sp.]